jgi:hypothetical protein
MQKTYLFRLQIGEPLANASKKFPPTGKAGDVVSPYFGKSGYLLQISLGKSAANFNIIGHLDKNLLPTYLNFYGDRYSAYRW